MTTETITFPQTNPWTHTPEGEPRGYIQPAALTELWFHTGTTCNLRCPFCLEGSNPGNNRIEPLTLADAQPFIDEGVQLGVEQYSFTGGEPFVIPEFIAILRAALARCPALVLTNGTEPVFNQFADVQALKECPHPVRFRVSLDFADAERHDAGRGAGNFRRAVTMLRKLYETGFDVSVARHREKDEDVAAADRTFQDMLASHGLPRDVPIVSFPEFLTPFSTGHAPHVTENCMTTYHTEESRAAFMCNYSKMVLKKKGRMRVYACTLVDDDEEYDLGATLSESMRARIMLKHHRCFTCFAYGASCSESKK